MQDPFLQQQQELAGGPSMQGTGALISPTFLTTESNASKFINPEMPDNSLLQMIASKKAQGSQEQKPQEAGKTQEQVMAESGQQSQLDQMRSQPEISQPAPQAFAPEPQKPVAQQLAETGQQNKLDQAGKQGVDVSQPAQVSQPIEQPAPQAVKPGESIEGVFGGDVSVTSRAGASGAGYVGGSRVNRGTDFAGPAGTKVSLPQGEWEIVDARNDVPGRMKENFTAASNYGWGNSIKARNKDTGEIVRYSHMQQGSVPDLKPGQVIKGGEVIGAIGNTGNTHGKTGNHLDVEYYDSKGNMKDILASDYGKSMTAKKQEKQEQPMQPVIPEVPQATQSAQMTQPNPMELLNFFGGK